jgi:hypothetical protein
MPQLVYVYMLGVGIALAALAFAVTDALLTPPPTPGVTEANVRRIRQGMSLAKVEGILGRPADSAS